MIGNLQNLVRGTDAFVARLYLSMCRERPALSCFLFHSLFRNRAEIGRDVIDPLDRTMVAHLQQLIEYYLEHGYRFVTPAQITAGLPPEQNCALITFDDGYFNNTLALPVLEQFGVPALFFISSRHVLQGKCFWWDVLYRERMAKGATPRQIYDEAVEMKYLTTEQIESQLRDRFGENALQPRCDIDRPFTAAELREFAGHPLVHLGNHTANHAILTNYSAAEARQQIRECQASLTEITGKRPVTISYPNGAYNEDVLSACREEGIELGFTVQPRKTALPLTAQREALLTLGRFVPHAQASISAQCRTYRSDVQLYGAFRSAYLRLARGRITN